jgi:diadenosine tetraphosphate (Ap4A) HIT family hydrolase
MNLASLGNVTPHLHWHVIARYADDAQFPGPIWAARQRTTDAATLAARRARLPALDTALRAALARAT